MLGRDARVYARADRSGDQQAVELDAGTAVHRRAWCRPTAAVLRRKHRPARHHQTCVRTDVRTQREWEDVLAWRGAQLVRSGFPHALAARLARDGRYDLHT